jgi:ElaB/YqjD/DUF883 family membrane-anchored ribosome-binding protein
MSKSFQNTLASRGNTARLLKLIFTSGERRNRLWNRTRKLTCSGKPCTLESNWRLKTAASHAVEDAVTEAKRFAKRSRYAAEDLIEDAAHRVKRDPLRSVGLGLAIGLGIGALAVWLATYNAKE